MRSFMTCLFLLLASGLVRAEVNVVPYDPETMQFEVTPDGAITVARQWAGSPNLSLTLTGVQTDDECFGADYYVLDAPDSQRFKVGCHTGQVWQWRNRSLLEAQAQSYNQRQQPVVDAAQIAQIAAEFAAAHYPNFAAFNMQQEDAEDHTVTFCSVLANGARFTGNRCFVQVNEYTGDVMGYGAITTGAVTISTTPVLAAAQAESAALGWLAADLNVGVAFTTGPSALYVTVDPLGQQRLIWYVPAATSADPNYTLAAWIQNEYLGAGAVDVYVDANTGEVVRRVAYLGAPGSRVTAPAHWRTRTLRNRKDTGRRMVGIRKAEPTLRLSACNRDVPLPAYPPIAIGRHVYIYAGYLRWSGNKMPLRYGRGGVVSLATPLGRAEFRPRHLTFVLNGHLRSLSVPPIVRNGRCYVPLEAAQAVLPFRISYDAKARVVRFDPVQRAGK
jgi:hypothetical protein